MEIIGTQIKHVIFYCDTCEHTNSQELGMEGFEALQVTYDSLTDAWKHLCSEPDHYIIALVEEEIK